ncbi:MULTISPECIES: ATP-binding protein [unclassified Gordonia (in: high G+C Gram-positive bacteria)]|uniref:sensor histidine kinase n=1 Tax=unclassified Gordonia (in: high G+C Gram-positive bacteria) TaxID=2657482 RepID=UPI0019623420|nr:MULTISPECIES: ATP-binding protein [unclassified Gordonia (in: high G+C Gram-positive bacteria)]MBN0971840.1 GHKL domain-containing protein [Gordonia sp. BP-119]MBN0981634.1 GHKL domain-containing protein [Gordonia sp. BP-94]WGJ87356.1 ATP-binding protein [Gordonia sp. SMJS1]
MRWYPRTLAGQVAALALAVFAVVVVAESVLAAVDARIDADRAARAEVTAVAVSLAESPSTVAALTSPDPSAVLQPVTERVRAATGIAFITVLAPDRTRYTHTDPARIGEPYLGSIDAALRGQTVTENYTGTLGPSIRTIVPVRDADGRVVGMVAAGITQRSLTSAWRGQLPLIALAAFAALLTAVGGVWWIRRRLLRQTGGLAPDELRLMYDHHDAVLRSVREGLVVVEDGRPALVNSEAHRLLEIGPDTAPADLPAFLTDGDEETDVTYADRGRVLLVSRSPVAGRRASSVVTIRDRTELSEAMGELDSMTRFAEALRSQAHEAANRLHTIVALVEMGRPDEAIRLATTEFELSQHLIDRMTQAVAEPALVALLLGKTAQAAERGIALSLTEESQVSDAATGLLTPGEMITVVGNLIDNALDACDPADPWVEVTVVGDDRVLDIVVADSGSGMDADLLALATTRGYSTKPGGDAAGRGLGLALVAQVVARRHGTMSAENTYGSVISVRVRADAGERGR